MIPAVQSLPYEEKLSRTGLWTLEDRRVRADLIEVYEIIHCVSSVSFDTYFEFAHNCVTKGHSLKLQKRRVFTDFCQHFFTERAINLWNSLDEECVSAVSVNGFKRGLQKLHTDGLFSRLFKPT